MNVSVHCLKMMLNNGSLHILYDQSYDHYVLRQLLTDNKTSKVFFSNMIICKRTNKIQKNTYIVDLYNIYGNCLSLFRNSREIGDMRLFITEKISKGRYRTEYYLILIMYFKQMYPYLFVMLASHAGVDCKYRMWYKYSVDIHLAIVKSSLHKFIVKFIENGKKHYNLQSPNQFIEQHPYKLGYNLHEISRYDWNFLRVHQTDIFDAVRLFVMFLDMETGIVGNALNPHIDGFINNITKFTSHNVPDQYKQVLLYTSELCGYIDTMNSQQSCLIEPCKFTVSLETLLAADKMFPTSTRDGITELLFDNEINTQKFQRKKLDGATDPFCHFTQSSTLFAINNYRPNLKKQLNVLYLNILKFFIDRANQFFCTVDVKLTKKCLLNINNLDFIIRTLSFNKYLVSRTRNINKKTIAFYARTDKCAKVRLNKDQLHYLFTKHQKPLSRFNFGFKHSSFSSDSGDYII